MSWRLGRSLHQGRGRRPRWLRRVALAGLLIALAGGGWVLARARESHEEALERQGGLGRVHAAAGPGADQRAVVWALGDGADGSPQAQRLAERIGRGRVDRFLYLGDVYENGTGDEFEDNFAPVYERLGRVTSPTPGNHDWPRHEEGYGPYWSRVQGRAPPSYYALSLGGWTLLSLNSEEPHGPGSAQLRWLDHRLRRGRGTCRLAFWHRPRYSAGTTHGDQPDVEPLWNTLRGRATLVLNGHEHASQRFRTIEGLTEIVAGAGSGAEPLYPLRADGRLAFGNDRDLAALRLELQPGRARFAFGSVDGRTLDSDELRCKS